MNSAIVKGNMKIAAGKAIQKFASVTGNKALYLKGKAAELLGIGERKLGNTREQLSQLTRRLMK